MLWIMSAVGLLLAAPLVVLLASRVISLALECARYADDILDHGVGLAANVAPVPALLETRSQVSLVTANAVGYVNALKRLG